MKIVLALLVAVAAVFAWLASRPAARSDSPPMEATGPRGPSAAVTAIPAATASTLSPSGMRVDGVLFRGAGHPASQAFISVGGAASRPFARGEPLAQGWTLAEVRPDHVILAHGETRARLDVVGLPLAANAQPATSDDAGAAGAAGSAGAASREAPLPGFIRLPPGAPLLPAVDTATNRRFVHDTRAQQAAR
ncbi:MAG TPA: hypothetical protein VHA82_19490 [Ramlibacter sp.]|uniref:hypothetical protein n=1 Tax=Ramlibacter sp. TaxID=1917967 RepID=UPI002D11A251|nr:hypothetical protein [Ramlibacter sp.]HVZ46001.1 hypothetical protein [Ramlibacter sp.]